MAAAALLRAWAPLLGGGGAALLLLDPWAMSPGAGPDFLLAGFCGFALLGYGAPGGPRVRAGAALAAALVPPLRLAGLLCGAPWGRTLVAAAVVSLLHALGSQVRARGSPRLRAVWEILVLSLFALPLGGALLAPFLGEGVLLGGGPLPRFLGWVWGKP